MFQQFINRKEELEVLEDRFRSKVPEFVILYGRRRVGKTELAAHFMRGKSAVYFLAEEKRYLDNLNEMKGLMADFLKDEEFRMIRFETWVLLFKSFLERIKERTAVVIDEFPYLVKENKAVPSEFQKIWDLYLSKSDKIMLVLVGSSISVMEKLLGKKSPLFGRRTAQLEIRPVSVFTIREFLPRQNMEACINIYGCLDGIPLYLRQFNDESGVFENMRNTFFKRDAPLYNESEILLKQEFREPANYFAILKAISFGYLRQSEIADYTGIEKSVISKYMKNLEGVRIINRQYPVTERKEKKKTSKYAFSDNYFRFWFRFIYPGKTLIERGAPEAFESAKHAYNQYMGPVFEKAAEEYLWTARSFRFTKIGRWWHKGMEIDLVALDENASGIFFFECKWSELKESGARKVLGALREKSAFLGWNKDRRIEHFGLFAKRVEGKELLKKEGFLVFDLEDFEKLTL